MILKLSVLENMIYKIMLTHKEMSIVDLTQRVYKGNELPENSNTVISCAIKRFNIKSKKYNLDHSLELIGTLGRMGKTVKLKKNQ